MNPCAQGIRRPALFIAVVFGFGGMLGACSVPLGGSGESGSPSGATLTESSSTGSSSSSGTSTGDTTGDTTGTSTGDTTGDTTGTSTGDTTGTPSEESLYLKAVKQMDTFDSTNCAVTAAGEVWCWGEGSNGILGSTDGADQSAAVKIAVSGPAKQVAVGGGHACALLGTGKVECWGRNDVGQVGNGSASTTPVTTPVEVSGLSSTSSLGLAQQISVGRDFSCALSVVGTIKCWGEGSLGQLGNGSTSDSSTPVALATTGAYFFEISAGEDHVCAMGNSTSTAYTVYCWGVGASGRQGTNSLGDTATPAEQLLVSSASDTSTTLNYGIVHLASGRQNSCDIAPLGQLYCAGKAGAGGMIGTASAVSDVNRTTFRTDDPTTFGSTDSLVLHASLGYLHACAVLTDGNVWCWGNGEYGRVIPSNLASTNYTTPQSIGLGSSNRFLQVSTGKNHSCALTSKGRVLCWGANSAGELGAGDVEAHTDPIMVKAGSATQADLPKQIVAGWNFACGLLADGTVKCWGDNSKGQLGFTGIVTTSSSSTPLATQIGTRRYRKLAAGATHVCGIEDNGKVSCWGSNSAGELGHHSTSTGSSAVSYSPVEVEVASGESYESLDGVIDISAGWAFSCAATGAGALYCWGNNSNGQIGNNSSTGTEADTAALVVLDSGELVFETGSGFLRMRPSVTSGSLHSCGVDTYGATYCWGSNGAGQLGIANATTKLSAMEQKAQYYSSSSCPSGSTTDLTNVSQLSAGGGSTCAVSIFGILACSGYNDKKQALPSASSSEVGCMALDPSFSTLWLSGRPATTVRTGMLHGCAISSSGSLHCWGDNSDGELGQGNTSSLSGVQTISSLSSAGGVIDAAVGYSNYLIFFWNNGFTCALSADGSTSCFGDNSYGQLGIGSTTDSSTPVAVSF